MKLELQNFIQQVLAEYAVRKSVELPKDFAYDLIASRDSSHGDFACNAAFKLTKILREKPAIIADGLLNVLGELKTNECGSMIDRAEIAGGGFINFYLTRNTFGQLIRQVIDQGDRYGISDYGQGKKVLIEFVSANPTGPLTIAHGRQAAIGDSLASILTATGHCVEREYYLNDAGRQMNLLGQSLWARYSTLLGKDRSLPEDGYQGEYLIDIARKLAGIKGDSLLKLTDQEASKICMRFATEEIMTGIKEDLSAIGVKMDHYFSEGTLYERNEVEKTLELLKEKGHLYEQDGALWFRSTVFGDDKDRVVRKSSGEATYLAPDIAYHRYKFERGFCWLINLLGPDHHGYVTRLKAACQALGHTADDIDVRIVQLTTLFRNGEPVRMSTRAGEFVTLRELVHEVGPDATRFFFIMRRVESHLDFDLELAKQKSQDNPVYYLQYAHARIASLIKFANRPLKVCANFELLASEEETALMRQVSEFPKALVAASQMLEPYRLADYLREVAVCFHKFYSHHRVVTEDEALTDARLVLVEAARIVLQNGLRILGISQPESM
jgi:arginyl-tRNA synthetase